MKVAAGHALAAVIAEDELGPEYVIPSVFNRDVAPAVAARSRRPPSATASRADAAEVTDAVGRVATEGGDPCRGELKPHLVYS